jgi:pyruvate decarboxylase
MEPGMDQAIYVGMAAPIRKACTVLMDEKTMAQEIDRVIEVAVETRQPVYIYVPVDVPVVQLDAKRLETPLKTEVTNSDKGVEDEIVKSTLEAIKSASAPAILADVLTIRHGGKELAGKLMNLTKFPTYSTPLGKGVVDETSPYYNGLYNGEGRLLIDRHSPARANRTLVSFDGVAKAIESSDLVLDIGPIHSDSNTGGFSRCITDDHTIILAHDYCQVLGKKYAGIHFLPVLKRLVEEIEKKPADYDIPKKQSWTKIEVSCHHRSFLSC